MAMRMSGLMSGLDTESIVQQLVEARSTKVTKAKNDQTKLEWKQDIWKGLNTKLKTLQSKLNDLRFTGGYVKKTTKISDSSVASILTSGEAMDTVQSLEVNRLARTAYLTGGKVEFKSGVSGGDITALTPLKFLANIPDGQSRTITLEKGDGTKIDFDLTGDSSISDVLTQFKDAGFNASFDENQKRFYISAKEVGQAGNFMLTGDAETLRALGLGTSFSSYNKITTQDNKRVTEQSTMSSVMGIKAADGANLYFKKQDGTEVGIALDSEMTIDDMVQRLKREGINASFDEKQQKLFIQDVYTVRVDGVSGPTAGTTGLDADKNPINDPAKEKEMKKNILAGLGLRVETQDAQGNEIDPVGYMSAGSFSGAKFAQGQDAQIVLNGVQYTSTNNVFEVNGLTITAQAETDPGKSVTLTTSQDTDGIYDMIKDFLKAYNEVIDEIDKLYNADVAKDYEPLSDDEKSKMSESEIEKYEQKIKDSLLRKDNNLRTVGDAMKKVMLQGATVNGTKMSLASFGIETLNYFLAKDGERNSYHIDGDSDDTTTSVNEDKLRKMITTDPDTVVSFFSQLTMNLYKEMDKQSKAVEGYRSFGNFYDDKKMKSEYDGYKSKIKDLEKKLADYEDKWYAKFAAMESAMAKMQKSASAITGLLGGGS